MNWNQIGKTILFGCLIFVFIGEAQPVAFPGAEGGGCYTTGGRGGIVYEVTNLSDAGVGSLRYGVESLSGARTIVFKVTGTIELTKVLKISSTKGNLTIAGQSAPGDGITVRNYSVQVDADNIIIRYMRFRMGDAAAYEGDALWGRNRKNIIIDHCSISWSTDECGSFYDNQFCTLQWCILSESLRISIHTKGNHGYGGIWGGQNVSFHHNLLAHHDSRNPRFCGSRYTGRPDLELVDFRNNVIYNWGANSGYAGEGGRYNMVNNYYKPGPATKSTVRTRIFSPNADDGTNTQTAGVWGTFYVNGNYMAGSTAVTNDNWQGMFPNPSTKNKNELRSDSAFTTGYVTTHSAENAYALVIAQAGARMHRDSVDMRILHEVTDSVFTFKGINGSTGGLIDTQGDVGGWPVLVSAAAPIDTDKDGMPDEWETAHSLNPNDPADRNTTNADGYTMLEVYVNGLVRGAGTGVAEIPQQPTEFSLSQNYPNPFNPTTAIAFRITRREVVTLKVVNLLGQTVAVLAHGINEPGTHSVVFDGAQLSSGIYFYQLTAGKYSETKRMHIVK
jgi:hypothetical protein